MTTGRVGIIGGTGLGAALGALGAGEAREVDTPFGKPSGPITLAEVGGIPVALLPRHGPGHVKNPSKVPYRANIYALKSLGVTHVLASAAVGSLREELEPRQLVIPDQIIDKTFLRANTFYDDLAVHVELAQPFCSTLRGCLLAAGKDLPVHVHERATYVCMEGPAFSTRAESEMHRAWGGDLIGMTVMPEAKLAREAELCYAMVSLPTDYDCWRPHPKELDTAELMREIIGNVNEATKNAVELLRRALPKVAEKMAEPCRCQSALSLAVMTDMARLSPETRERLKLLLGKYLG